MQPKGVATHGLRTTVIDQGNGENCRSACECTVDANLRVLNLVIVKTGGYSRTNRCQFASAVGNPKEVAESESLSVSLRRGRPPICCQKALKEGRQEGRETKGGGGRKGGREKGREREREFTSSQNPSLKPQLCHNTAGQCQIRGRGHVCDLHAIHIEAHVLQNLP